MSTRGNICVKLRKEDLDKALPLYDVNKKQIGEIYTKNEYPYMFVYCHHDSYESGLGRQLLENLNNYEDVRDYILQGDRTSFSTPYTELGENINDLTPQFSKDIEGKIPEEYFYVFDDNQWKVKSYTESCSNKPFRNISIEK